MEIIYDLLPRLLFLLTLVILLPVNSPFSITKYVYVKSDQGDESSNNRVTMDKVATRVTTLMTVITDKLNRTKMDLMMGDVNTILNNNNSAEPANVNEINLVSLTSNLTYSNNLTNSNNLTSQDSFNEKAFYILIKSLNNKTRFVLDKVTLIAGDKVYLAQSWQFTK